jgi:hypothetical protein
VPILEAVQGWLVDAAAPGHLGQGEPGFARDTVAFDTDICEFLAILARICSRIRKNTANFAANPPTFLRMRLRTIANDFVHAVPLTPLRAKSGAGVVAAVQVVDGHWVMIGDPCATFFRDLAQGGATGRLFADESWLFELAPARRAASAKAFSKNYPVQDWHQAVTCVCKTRKRHATHLRVSGPVISLKAP